MTNPYTFTDNPTESGVAVCNTDILNDDIMCLKWYYDHISFRNIGEIVASTIPLTDAGLHLLDGALLSGSGVYADFVTYIASLYSASPLPSYFTTESDWQDSVTTYGVCGKFVYDSVNNTVRLPKITGFIEGAGGISTLGNITEAGLPNITGGFNTSSFDDNNATGAFSSTGTVQNITLGTSGGSRIHADDFDASRSSDIYGNSSTVQPQSVKVLYYIAVASLTKTEIQVDIDEIATDLNGKADVDLSNTPNTLPNVFIDKFMPDYDNGISLLHQSGNYRMPSAGIVCTSGYWTSGDPIGLAINNIVIAECSSTSVNKNFHAQVLVSQGDKVEVGLLPGGATSQSNILFANFYPLKGANLGGV